MKQQRDWTQIKARYQEGTHTVKQLSQTFGVPARTIYDKAKKEQWGGTKNTQSGPLQPARECVDLLLRAVREALQKEEMLQSTRQVKCKGKTDTPAGAIDRNWVEEEPTGAYDIGKIKEFTAALDSLVSLKRDLYDLPTGTETERRLVAREKLEMARQKMMPAEAQPLQVLFSEELESWSD